MKIETRAVHAGRHIDPATGAVTAPIHLSTTFERNPDGEYPRGYSYSREDNPNRHALEECLASLEDGKQALCFSSGLAVATALVQGLEPGDHIIAPDDVYWGLRKVIGEVFGKWGLETSYVDMTSIDDFHAALRPNTRLVWIETPSNPLMKVTDLTSIAALARLSGPEHPHGLRRHVRHAGAAAAARLRHRHGGALDDEIHRRPQRRDRRGADHAARQLPFRARAQIAALRRQRAFAVRLLADAARHRYPALAGARAIGECDAGGAVSRRSTVRWRRCTIRDCPVIPRTKWRRARCRRSAACSLSRCGDRGKTRSAVAARCKLFIRATSLGGAHSLIEHRASIEGPNTRTPQNLLRLSIGLEHTDDLIADLEQALSTIPA